MDKSAVLDDVSGALDVIEDQLDVIEAVPSAIANNKLPVIVVAVVALAAGGVGGYLIAKKRLATKYSVVLNDEIEKTRDFYARINKEGDYADPVELAADLGFEQVEVTVEEADTDAFAKAREIIEGKGYTSYAKPETVVVEEVTVTRAANVFDNVKVDAAGDYDLGAEEAKGERGEVFVIEEERYYENENEWDQYDLTWYEGDKTLADAEDKIIDDVKLIVGEGNLVFGRGSRSTQNVFLRNPKRQTEYEVTVDSGKYSEVVMGFIQHSDDRRPTRKFRLNADD